MIKNVSQELHCDGVGNNSSYLVEGGEYAFTRIRSCCIGVGAGEVTYFQLLHKVKKKESKEL